MLMCINANMLIYVTQTSLRDSCGLGREHRRKRNSHQQNWRLFLSAGKKATVFIFLDDITLKEVL